MTAKVVDVSNTMTFVDYNVVRKQGDQRVSIRWNWSLGQLFNFVDRNKVTLLRVTVLVES